MNQLLSRNIQKKTKLRMKARNSFKLEIETEAKDFVLILYKISLLWRNISFLDQILTFVEANDVHKYLAPPPPLKIIPLIVRFSKSLLILKI